MSGISTGEISVAGLCTPLIQAGPENASEAVVFLHGNPGSRLDWEALVEGAGEFGRALAFDMPGFGQADAPRDFGYRIEDYARFIDGALGELGVNQPTSSCTTSEAPSAFAGAPRIRTPSAVS